MRDPKRIEKIMSIIQLIWEKYPDTRFNQLIDNLQTDYAQKHDIMQERWEKEEWRGIVSYRRNDVADLFNLEDDKFLGYLEEKVRGLENGLF